MLEEKAFLSHWQHLAHVPACTRKHEDLTVSLNPLTGHNQGASEELIENHVGFLPYPVPENLPGSIRKPRKTTLAHCKSQTRHPTYKSVA
jgi:hypothetical protein